MTRYDPIQIHPLGGRCRGEMGECADGDFVRYEDMVALLKKFVDAIQPLNVRGTKIRHMDTRLGAAMDEAEKIIHTP